MFLNVNFSSRTTSRNF